MLAVTHVMYPHECRRWADIHDTTEFPVPLPEAKQQIAEGRLRTLMALSPHTLRRCLPTTPLTNRRNMVTHGFFVLAGPIGACMPLRNCCYRVNLPT